MPPNRILGYLTLSPSLVCEASAIFLAARYPQLLWPLLTSWRAMAKQSGHEIEIYPLDVAGKAAVFAFADKVIPTLSYRRLLLINSVVPA